ncbi:hypothetical protein C2845_PM03G26270 [Panicum miliaceum]|uniref:Uncharacterized protein n=1 Tax=Panicum miliaceum TaxID=4540 RepID=A0A3L6TAJ1_PANMI|nr:hypothetical protein C2845_PM03G26270 [Panicum miliaceum]
MVLYADGGDLPVVLKRFLTEEDHIFTVPKAAPIYEYLSGPHPLFGVRCSSLEKIARVVLCLPRLGKPEGADHDNWHSWYLLPSQVKYTATDAYLSYEIAKQLEIKDGYRF